MRVPTIVLFAVLIFLPQARLRVGQIKGILSAPVPTRMRSAQVGVLTVLLVALLASQFSPTKQLELGEGLAYALVAPLRSSWLAATAGSCRWHSSPSWVSVPRSSARSRRTTRS